MSSSSERPVLLQNLCGVCHVGEQKYKCPGCGVRYCSVECFKLHKSQTGCSGQVDVVKYKPRAELMNQASVDRDYNFLLRLDRAVKGRSEAGTKENLKGKYINETLARRYVDKRGVHVYSVPRGMERSKLNKSGWNKKLRSYCWTIGWSVVDQNLVIHSHRSPRIAENVLLKDAVPKELFDSGGFERNNAVFLLEKVNSKTPVLLPLNSEKTLQEELRSKFVIEFPIIFVCFPRVESNGLKNHPQGSQTTHLQDYTIPKGYTVFVPPMDTSETDTSSSSSDSESSSESESESEGSSSEYNATLNEQGTVAEIASPVSAQLQATEENPARCNTVLSGYGSDSSQYDPPEELSSRQS